MDDSGLETNWTLQCSYFETLYNGSYPDNFTYRKECDLDETVPEIGVNEYVRIPMYVLIFIVCVVGNTLVIVTLLQNRKMRTVTNIFLINLSVGDLLLGVFCMPFTLTGQILKSFLFGAAMCKIVPYFQVVSVAVSTFTLVSISIERLFAICYPLTSRRWQTVSHSIKMTIVCWILSFVVAFPVLFYSTYFWYKKVEDVDYYACRERYPTPQLGIAYNIFLLITLFGLPGIFMTLAYVKITLTLYRGMRGESQSYSKTPNGSLAKFSMKFSRVQTNTAGTKSEFRNGSMGDGTNIPRSITVEDMDALDAPMVNSNNPQPPHQQYAQTPSPVHGVRSTHTERNLAAKKRVILMLIIVVFEFFLCFTPLWIVSVLLLFGIGTSSEVLLNSIPYLQLLMYISTCCNPITYCFLHSKFRQGFIQAFKCGKSKQDISDLSRIRTSRATSYRRNESCSSAASGLGNKHVTRSEFDLLDLCDSNPNLLAPGPDKFRIRSNSAW